MEEPYFVEPTPFEPHLPESVRALLAEARAGRGPLKEWLEARKPGGWGQLSSCFALLRGDLSAEVIGWVTGMSLFVRDSLQLVKVLEHHKLPAPAPFMLEAMAAGLRAGLPTVRRQWEAAARLDKFSRGAAPAAFVEVLPIGLASDAAGPRGAALAIAQRAGEAARVALERAHAGDAFDTKAKKRLAEALAALGGAVAIAAPSPNPGDDERGALLERLVAAYEATFDPALVEPILTTGAEEGRRRGGPVTAKSKSELEAAWLALAEKKDVRDVDRLMDALWPGTWKQALTRVNALRKFPSDPRIAQKLPELLGRYDSLGAAPFRGEASALLRRMTKEQQGAAPEALLREASKNSGGAVDLGALWDAVWSEPANDDRRAVLADALSAANDPRGEFMSLSLAMSRGLTDPKARKRAAALLKDNIDAWTGNIPGAELGSRVFERGFLSRVRIVLSRPAELERSAAAKEWRTVEELFVDQNGYFHEAEASALAKVLPALVSLRALVIQRWAGDSFFKTLVDAGPFPAIRSLGSAEWPIDLKNTAFPSLELFGTMSKEPAVAMELARRFGARTVVLFVTGGRLADAVEELDGTRIDELRVVLEGGYGQFLVPRNWTLRFRHGHDEVSLYPWSSRYEKGSIADPLERVRALKRKTVRIARPATGGADLEAEVASLTKSHKLAVRFDAEPMSLWRR